MRQNDATVSAYAAARSKLARVRWRLRPVLAAGALGAALCAGRVAGADGDAAATPASIRIADGALAGVSDGTVESFKGVPYATPPVGPLRWRPPEDPQPWAGVREAAGYGPSCMQPAAPPNVPFGSAAERTSEDCLTLNVWAPAKPGRGRAVMVWLHGGGHVTGSGSDRFTDGTAFARDGVVLVTLNYRLGVFGFFVHPALVREAQPAEARPPAPLANYGLMDQVAALRWVRRNIAAFGGDPQNVTLFGESAGGEDVVALLTAPSARGLFAKAIVESGGFWEDLPPLSAAAAQGSELAAKLALPGADATGAQLRAVKADALVQLAGSEFDGPIVDGRFLPQQPANAIAAGDAAALPLIIGTNDNEGSLLRGAGAAPGQVDPGLTPRELATLRAGYGAAAASDAAFAAFLFRDRYFAAPARRLAAQLAPRASAYLYQFTYVLDGLRGLRSAANHGSEIPLVFASWPVGALSPQDAAETDALHGCWVAFAQTGVPRCPGAPEWPRYTRARDEIMVFGAQNAVRPAPNVTALDLLDTIASGGTGARTRAP